MRRRQRTPGTQLLRAGERTRVVMADIPIDEVRFRASVLNGTPAGRIEIERSGETESEMHVQTLGHENNIDARGLIQISVVPEADTAITFLPVKRPSSLPAVIGGAVLVFGAIGWTAMELFGG
jgi:hypothetical protein